MREIPALSGTDIIWCNKDLGNTKHTHSRPAVFGLWPYLIFTIIVGVYNYLFLPDGFNATDEGWLLSLAQRITDGQVPYRDFYFLINPLAIYIQSLLLTIFGDNYTIMASRIYWAGQMWAMMVFFSMVYRNYVNKIELLLLLLTSWAVSTLLIQYPWYNYEAAFYTALAIVALGRRRYFLFGMLAFLGFWAKQNFILFLPLVLLSGYILKLLHIKTDFLNRAPVLRTLSGFAIPAAIYLVYLVFEGSLVDYITNAYIFLPEITARGWLFGIFQNNHIAVLFSLPILALAFILAYAKNIKWLIIPVLIVPILILLYDHRTVFFSYNAAIFNHAVLVFLIWHIKKANNPAARNILLALLPLQLTVSVLVYLSGFSYVGIVSSYMGSGVALTVSYCSLKSAAPSVYKKYFPAVILIFFLIVGSVIKYNHVYRDAPRDQLLSEFTSGKLKSIRTTARNYRQITDLVRTVEQYTKKGDYILIYPDFPVLYYLTDRKNPTRVDWYYWRGLHPDMLVDAAKMIMKYKPKIIFVQKYSEEDYSRQGTGIDYANTREYKPLFEFVNRHYKLEKTIGDIFLFVPGF